MDIKMFAKIGDLKSGIIPSEKKHNFNLVLKIKIVGMVSTRTRIQIRLQKPLDQILPELHCSERKKKIIILHDESKFAHISTFLRIKGKSLLELCVTIMCHNDELSSTMS